MATLSWLAEVLGFAALYLIFAGQVSGAEAVAALTIGLGATLLRDAVTRASKRRFAPHGVPAWRLAAAVSARLAEDILVLAPHFLALAHPRSVHLGRNETQSFRFGRNSPGDITRRAVAVLAASLAPNAFVVDRAGRRDVLVHRLAPRAGSASRDWLV